MRKTTNGMIARTAQKSTFVVASGFSGLSRKAATRSGLARPPSPLTPESVAAVYADAATTCSDRRHAGHAASIDSLMIATGGKKRDINARAIAPQREDPSVPLW